jgi:hypothetical protein
MQSLRQIYNSTQGAGMLLFIMVFGFISIGMIIFGVVSYAIFEHQVSVRNHVREQSFHIAEAGVNYYRWHLAHAPTDYTDGTDEEGPYQRPFTNKDGEIIGYYSLDIIPPAFGTSVVTIRSTGWTIERPDITRTIQVRLGYPGLADYAFVNNGNMRFSQTTQVHGKVHANGGIEFNGQSDAPIQSGRETYESNGTKNGIWGTGGPTEFWNFPVPEIDFGAITADLALLKTMAEERGLHFTHSGQNGYYLEFQANGTVDIYRVNSVSCYYGNWYYTGTNWIQNNHCFDVSNRTLLNSYNLNDISVIFVEDTVWVSGTVNGYVTVVAAAFPESPSNYKQIIIQDNLVYAEVASDDALGLISQGNIIVPRNIPTNMTIHAAVLSQYGMIQRPYYSTTYSAAVRQSLFFFGSQISYGGGGWKWINSSGTVVNGFIDTNHTYDGNLLYYPPPGFPVGNTYELISWEEIE